MAIVKAITSQPARLSEGTVPAATGEQEGRTAASNEVNEAAKDDDDSEDDGLEYTRPEGDFSLTITPKTVEGDGDGNTTARAGSSRSTLGHRW
ncbi:hypothetical protein FALCPG4_001346 [Fusarium falciforme]